MLVIGPPPVGLSNTGSIERLSEVVPQGTDKNRDTFELVFEDRFAGGLP